MATLEPREGHPETLCPSCRDEGRLQEVAAVIKRSTSAGTQLTLRCAICGWQETYWLAA